jgi:hypothetical protein
MQKIQQIFSKLKQVFFLLAEKIRRRPVLVALVILIYVLFNNVWTYQAAFFWSLFFLFLILNLDNRILIFYGLLFLFLAPFYSIFKQPLAVQRFSDYAYYFLFMAVFLQLIAYMREKLVNFWKIRNSRYEKNL